MKLRTEVHLKESTQKIKIEDKIFSIGSCFATEMAILFQKGQLQSMQNPFGTLFNPYSINTAIQNLANSHFYQEQDLVMYRDKAMSLEHHTDFDSQNIQETLLKINKNIEQGHQFLKNTNWVIITYGTSFVYEFLPKQKLVANCHKIPAKYFQKRVLSSQEIKNSIQKTIQALRDICSENVQILFSVSPVRHTKDGMVENSLSKALLVSATHEAILNETDCHYLPIYEIMMDDLRDYRFYKEDMIHPSQQAVNYIFEEFSKAYFSKENLEFVKENFKIHQALHHRPSDSKSAEYQAFLEKIKEKIAHQQSKTQHKIFMHQF